jgi:hypothetical protein
MLTTKYIAVRGHGERPDPPINCDYCGGAEAVISMFGYGDDFSGNCHWCANCAMQLVRKLMEDLCELQTQGGRHG